MGGWVRLFEVGGGFSERRGGVEPQTWGEV